MGFEVWALSEILTTHHIYHMFSVKIIIIEIQRSARKRQTRPQIPQANSNSLFVLFSSAAFVLSAIQVSERLSHYIINLYYLLIE